MVESNRTLIILLALIISAGTGYSYWQFMYKPAHAALQKAQAADAAALTAKQSAQTQLDSLETAKPNFEALAKSIVSTVAIPKQPRLITAGLQIEKVAKRTGVKISDTSKADDAGGTTGTGTQVDLKLTTVGTYSEISDFIRQLEEPVRTVGSKVYISNRLINVISVSLSTDASEGAGAVTGSESTKLKKYEIVGTIVVRLYFGESGSAATATAGVDPATGLPATGSATDPAAAGGEAGAVGSATAPTDGGTAPVAPSGADTASQPSSSGQSNGVT